MQILKDIINISKPANIIENNINCEEYNKDPINIISSNRSNNII